MKAARFLETSEQSYLTWCKNPEDCNWSNAFPENLILYCPIPQKCFKINPHFLRFIVRGRQYFLCTTTRMKLGPKRCRVKLIQKPVTSRINLWYL